MRHLLVAIALFAFLTPVVGGCIVAPHRRYHRGHRHRANCARVCTRWTHRRRCSQRCQVYRNGVCVSYRQVCARDRYCSSYRTRCR